MTEKDIKYTGTMSGDMGLMQIELTDVLPVKDSLWGVFQRKRCCPDPFPDSFWFRADDGGTRITIYCQACEASIGAISFGRLSQEHAPLSLPR